MQRSGAPRRQASALSPPKHPAGVATANAARRSTAPALSLGDLGGTDLLQSWAADFGSGEGIQSVQGAPRQPSVPGGLPSSAQRPSDALAQLNLQDFSAGYSSHAERTARRLPLGEHDFSPQGIQTDWAFPSKPQPRWR